MFLGIKTTYFPSGTDSLSYAFDIVLIILSDISFTSTYFLIAYESSFLILYFVKSAVVIEYSFLGVTFLTLK